MQEIQVSEKTLHTESLTSNWWCSISLMLVGSQHRDYPIQWQRNEVLGWYYLGSGQRRVTVWVRLTCSLCALSSLLSSMVCLCFLGGSWMTALTLLLMVLSPLLAWARDTPRKCIPLMVSYCGGEEGGKEITFVTVSRPCPLEYCGIFFNDHPCGIDPQFYPKQKDP